MPPVELLDLDGDGVPEFVFSYFNHDAKAHVVSQSLWAYDHAGREITRQPPPAGVNAAGSWDALLERDVRPMETDVTDGEYCDSDCGGFTIGRAGADGSRPILAAEGDYVLRAGRYVLRPRPPKPAPKPAPRRARRKQARKKPSR
jgi:hypothetical protein